MILVDVTVPSLEKIFEFKLNEDVPVSIVTDEIISVVCQKEKCGLQGDKNNMMLLKLENREILDMDRSLYQNNVNTGDNLILV